MTQLPIFQTEIQHHPYPLLFVTVSGAHLYGFPSADSDYDLRGVHILPAREMLGLDEPEETLENSYERDGLEIDLVTHDVGKFFRLMLKRNGYVLEQLLSPLVVHTTPEHEQLKAITQGCITRHHAHHYLGFARNQWQLLVKEPRPRVKPLLYTYRVLLTGIYLMQTGQVEANLVYLNETFHLPYIPELIERKLSGGEQVFLTQADLTFYEREMERLTKQLEEAFAQTTLPETPTTRPQLHQLLIHLRLQTVP
jgi:predicted nucleotidyltransferase